MRNDVYVHILQQVSSEAQSQLAAWLSAQGVKGLGARQLAEWPGFVRLADAIGSTPAQVLGEIRAHLDMAARKRPAALKLKHLNGLIEQRALKTLAIAFGKAAVSEAILDDTFDVDTLVRLSKLEPVARTSDWVRLIDEQLKRAPQLQFAFGSWQQWLTKAYREGVQKKLAKSLCVREGDELRALLAPSAPLNASHGDDKFLSQLLDHFTIERIARALLQLADDALGMAAREAHRSRLLLPRGVTAELEAAVAWFGSKDYLAALRQVHVPTRTLKLGDLGFRLVDDDERDLLRARCVSADEVQNIALPTAWWKLLLFQRERACVVTRAGEPVLVCNKLPLRQTWPDLRGTVDRIIEGHYARVRDSNASDELKEKCLNPADLLDQTLPYSTLEPALWRAACELPFAAAVFVASGLEVPLAGLKPAAAHAHDAPRMALTSVVGEREPSEWLTEPGTGVLGSRIERNGHAAE